MSSETALLGMFALVAASFVMALAAFIRTRDVTPLEKFVTARTTDLELTSVLEQRFMRLSPAAQESIMKLIRVADPITDYWPGDLDNRVVAWLQEITDAVPVKSKPPITPLPEPPNTPPGNVAPKRNDDPLKEKYSDAAA